MTGSPTRSNSNTLPADETVGHAEVSASTAQIDVFIVDDEEIITQLITELLEDAGYSVRVFHDGASALLEIIRQPPRLVILDIGLPVMTGDEVLQLVRKQGILTLPVIIMSAGAPLQTYLSKGATEILAKPFDVDMLLQQVNFYLQA